MADLKISQLTDYTTPLSADIVPIVDTANVQTKKVSIANLLNVLANLFTIKDSSDTTKKVAFNVSGITTGTTRTLTVPDASDTLTLNATAQTLTNKTLGTGTKINTSGTDTTGSLYYKDSGGNLAVLAPGTEGQFLDMTSGLPTWVANPASIKPFPVQDIALLGNSVTYSNLIAITSNSDASVIFVALIDSSGALFLFRLAKDIKTGNYYQTIQYIGITGFATSTVGVAIAGNYVYVSYNFSATKTLTRYLAADLTGATSFTFSGTARADKMFSDGTNLYIYNGTGGTFDKFTLSGTVATNASTITYTSGGVVTGVISDGVNVWMTDGTSSSIATAIRKYPIAGGASSSTTTIYIAENAYLDGTNPSFFLSSSMLGIGWAFTWCSPTANIGIGVHLMAITLP